MNSRSMLRENNSRERGAILGSRLQRLVSVHGLRISDAKLRELGTVISEIDDFLATLPMEEVASCFAEASELRAGLVRLVIHGARLSPTGAQTKGTNQALLRHVGTVACSVAGQLIGHIALPPSRVSPVLPELLDFNRRLLRAQTLQACAREAATAVERLMPGARPRPRQEEWGAATAAFLRALWLLGGFSMHAGTLSGAKPGIQRRRALSYLAEFASALAGSCVMEHTARLLLLLLLTPALPGEGNDALTQMARRFTRAFSGLTVALQIVEKAPDGPTSAAALQLRGVLSGPCTNHALLSLGVASLAAVDGGPSHGLPAVLLRRAAATRLAVATAVGAGARRSDGSSGVQRDSAQQEAAAARERAAAEDLSVDLRHSVLGPLTQNTRLPLPPGRRAAKSLCLRVCRLAVAQAEAEAAQQAAAVPPHGGAAGAAASSGGRSRGAPPAPALLPPQIVSILAVQALTVAWVRMLPQRLPAPGDGSGSGPVSAAWAAEAAELWRQAVAVVRYAMGGLSADEVSWLASMLARLPQEGLPAFMERHGLASLPPRPPPALAAALEGGLLPCLERLLRRAGEDSASPETRIVDALPRLTLPSASLFVLLLAYGDPRQAAALVVTLAKQLRRLDAGPSALKPCGVTGRFPRAAMLADGVLCALVKRLVAAPDAGQSRSVSSAAAPAPASRQLGDLASLAAALWLPQLSRLVLRTLELTEWRVGSQERLHLYTLLDWVNAAVARCKAAAAAAGAAAACSGGVGGGNGGGGSLGSSAWQPPNAAAAAAAAAAVPCVREGEGEGGEEEDGGCAGWRVLLVGMGAVRLVLAALRLEAEAPHGGPDFKMRLTALGCDVAATCPEEARAVCSDPRYFGSLGVCSAWNGILKASELRGRGRKEAPGRPAVAEAAAEAEASPAAAAAAQRPARGAPGAFRLAHPAAARQLLLQQRWCGHPGCTNLGGDSEAELPWEPCPSCGEVGYCCIDCRTAHWWTGHMAECRRQQGGG